VYVWCLILASTYFGIKCKIVKGHVMRKKRSASVCVAITTARAIPRSLPDFHGQGYENWCVISLVFKKLMKL